MERFAKPIFLVARCIALAMTVFHLVIAFIGPPEPLILRSAHVGFALVLTFLFFGWKGKHEKGPGILDLLFVLGSLAAAGYPIYQLPYIYERFIYVDPLITGDWVFGCLLIVLVLEGTRRLLGLALPLTAIAFLCYALFFTETDRDTLMEQLFLTTEGIFGIPVAVSATYMVLFIVFGALVERMGVGRLFMDFAVAITGRSSGGPAKVACVTSGMFGTVSGSAVANVMTTGTFSIPLMKRIGYRPGFAGAVEAVASTGGQIMPPIMGAAAFVMAEYLGVSYLTVTKYALLPAALYFIAVFATVHFEAKRLGMKGMEDHEIPKVSVVLKEQGHMFIPLIVIISVLIMGYSAPYSALCGIASVIPAALLRKTTRQYVTIGNILGAMEAGARNTLPIALACACAGIVVGVIDITGAGLSFTGLVLSLAQDTLVLALIATMIAGIILGMGMPTTPAYIVQVALLVPALVKLGVQLEAAHLFVFYFAILSAITPPVAMAVYAAMGISKGGIWESGLAAMKLGATGYIVPFMFVYGPALLLIGDFSVILAASVTAITGAVCLSASLNGYLLVPMGVIQRLTLFVTAITLIHPGLATDAIGFGLLVAVLIKQLMERKGRNSGPAPAGAIAAPAKEAEPLRDS